MTTPNLKTSFQSVSSKSSMLIVTGALLIAQTLPLSPVSAQAAEARPAEICTSPGFGGSLRNPLPDYKKCAGAPAAALAAGLTQTEIFWVPTAQLPNALGVCSATGPLSATLPKGIRTFTLINIVPGRQLTVNGTGDGDVLIGSAGSSDRLVGKGGQDTYVVGGLLATLTVQAPDVIYPSSTVVEQDDLTLGGSTEFIHINPGSGGQNDPGPIQTPLSITPITPRGGFGVPLASRPAAVGSCQAFLPPWGGFHPTLNMAVASRPTGLSSDRTDAPASLLAQPLQTILDSRNPENGSTGRPCNSLNCGLSSDNFRAEVRDTKDFPGAPTLRGFNIESPDVDQIFIPSRNLVFQGKPINIAFPPGKAIPILVVNEGAQVRFGPARLLKQSQIRELQRRSQGLLNVKNEGIPLVYFRANGLLVISQSDAPLGTAANPGVVVARLLDNTNKPLALPVSNDGIYLSRFLTFTASPKTSEGGSGGTDIR